jgi:hypothetical protein
VEKYIIGCRRAVRNKDTIKEYYYGLLLDKAKAEKDELKIIEVTLQI